MGDATISGLRMALATQNASPENGVLGIGLPIQESVAIRNRTAVYPNLVDVMYSTGVIGKRAYSVYLNSLCEWGPPKLGPILLTPNPPRLQPQAQARFSSVA